MNTATSDTSLRDAMYAMSLAKRAPDAELLDQFVRQYPRHAEALMNFAIELALDALEHGDDEVDVPANSEVISPVVSRVMSKFQNGLFAMAHKRVAEPPPAIPRAPAANPFASLDRKSYRALASHLHINTVMLSKLRDRQIEPTTIPRSFCRYVADNMDEDIDALCSHFLGPQEAATARQYFRADNKPNIWLRQSFEDAVRNSGLSEEQQQRLLSFCE